MLNLEYKTNLSNYTDDQLTSMRNDLCNEHRTAANCAITRITELIEIYIPAFMVSNLYNDRLVLIAKNRNRWLDINIYFGKSWWDNEKGFKFQINPSSVGAFDILGTSDEINYYTAIGTIISNAEFNSKLLDILKEFELISKQIDKDIYVINNEIDSRKRLAELEAERSTAKENFAATEKAIIDHLAATLNDDYYVCVCTTPQEHLVNATYRNKNIQILPVGVNVRYDAERLLPYGKNYKVINIKKIKLI